MKPLWLKLFHISRRMSEKDGRPSPWSKGKGNTFQKQFLGGRKLHGAWAVARGSVPGTGKGKGKGTKGSRKGAADTVVVAAGEPKQPPPPVPAGLDDGDDNAIKYKAGGCAYLIY